MLREVRGDLRNDKSDVRSWNNHSNTFKTGKPDREFINKVLQSQILDFIALPGKSSGRTDKMVSTNILTLPQPKAAGTACLDHKTSIPLNAHELRSHAPWG
jgi:hypothetical protein